MKDSIADFKRTRRFLVCVDSDGCAMDTMDIKHMKCFGPIAIEQWGLQAIEKKFMQVWNKVNLYSKTRGINRFKGLVTTFQALKEEGLKMPPFNDIAHWTENTKELSNPSLEKAIAETGSQELKMTLAWSKAVNKAINSLEGEDKPFPKAKEGLKIISSLCDVAIVSSANGSAVEAEWTKHGLSSYVQVMLGQEAGTKAHCIEELKKHGYGDDEILMVGDAPGDLEAALKNSVLYYPILVGKEKFSWERLATSALESFLSGSYRGAYQNQLTEEFKSNLE